MIFAEPTVVCPQGNLKENNIVILAHMDPFFAFGTFAAYIEDVVYVPVDVVNLLRDSRCSHSCVYYVLVARYVARREDSINVFHEADSHS